MKRIVSFVIVAVMLLSFASASAFAEEYKLGDVTGDGKYNLTDASMMMKYIAGWSLDSERKEIIEQSGDCNKDGKVNLLDVSKLLRHIAKVPLPR